MLISSRISTYPYTWRIDHRQHHLVILTLPGTRGTVTIFLVALPYRDLPPFRGATPAILYKDDGDGTLPILQVYVEYHLSVLLAVSLSEKQPDHQQARIF